MQVLRILGTEKKNRKAPLTVNILKEIVQGADLSDTLQRRTYVYTFYVLLASLFTMSLRLEETKSFLRKVLL